MKNIRRILKYVFIAVILVLNIALITRIYMSADTSVLGGLFINDTLKSAYSSYGDDFSAVKYMVAETMTASGEFSAYSHIYIPSANQLQVTVRINRRVLEEYFLDSVDRISFVLSDPNDSVNPESARICETKYMYNYVKLVFDDVIIPQDNQIYLIAYIGGTRLAGLILFDPQDEPREYKLSKSELSELQNSQLFN